MVYLDVEEGDDCERKTIHNDKHRPYVLFNVALHVDATDPGADEPLVVESLGQVDVLDEDGVREDDTQRHHPDSEEV